MARPRTHTDDELLERIEAALRDRPRVDWTLAEVASSAGVHAATLVKRFGSKRGLTAAISERWIDGIPTAPTTGDPVRELHEWIDAAGNGAARAGGTEHHAAENAPTDRLRAAADIAMLLDDLLDDELGALLQQGWAAQASYARSLLAAARASGALTRAPEDTVAAQILLDTLAGERLRHAASAEHTRTIRTTRSLLESWT